MVLVGLSVFSLTLIIAKILAFVTARIGRAPMIAEALERIDKGDFNGARKAIGHCRHPISQMIDAGAEMAESGRSPAQIRAALQALAQSRFAELERHNRMLELIGLVAPLLGLLGTILGMIKAFQALQSASSQVDPAVLAGGIWEALLTTALGLAVAIPAIIAFNLAENRIEAPRQQTSASLARLFAGLETSGRA